MNAPKVLVVGSSPSADTLLALEAIARLTGETILCVDQDCPESELRTLLGELAGSHLTSFEPPKLSPEVLKEALAIRKIPDHAYEPGHSWPPGRRKRRW